MILNGLLGSWECIATLVCITLIPLLLTMPTFSAELFRYSKSSTNFIYCGNIRSGIFTHFKNV